MITAPLTDAGNAQVFADEHGAYLKWVPDWVSWVRYDGKRWRRVPNEEMIPLAVQTARGFFARAADKQLDRDTAQALAKHARQTEAAGRLEAMVRLARGYLVMASDRFDQNHFLLNVDNGTLDLRAPGSFREHSRDDMLTMFTPVKYEAKAECPLWLAFLGRVLPDADLRAFLQRFSGYCLTGDVSEQVLAFFHGRGANGKTTLLEILLAVLGEYAKPGAPDLLLAKRGETHPTEQADLQSARLVVCQETEAGRKWAESLVKRLTGGDQLKARWMRGNFFAFDPTHKLIVSANHKPKVRGQDHGIWRRIKLVPFTVTIPKSEQDRELVTKLRAEAAGILSWLVEGCVAWQRSGLGEPAAVTQATAEYRAEQDHLGHFVEDECEVDSEAWVGTTPLYNVYTDWCERTGMQHPWERETFREGLIERGFTAKRKPTGDRGLSGVRLKRGAAGAA